MCDKKVIKQTDTAKKPLLPNYYIIININIIINIVVVVVV